VTNEEDKDNKIVNKRHKLEYMRSPSVKPELIPSEDRRLPNEMFRVDASSTLAAHFFVLLKHGIRQTYYVLTFPMSE